VRADTITSSTNSTLFVNRNETILFVLKKNKTPCERNSSFFKRDFCYVLKYVSVRILLKMSIHIYIYYFLLKYKPF